VKKLHGNPWAVLAVVSLGFFMTLLDMTCPGARIFDQRHRLMTCQSPEEKL
jgi:hypothetical protein